LPAAVGGTLAVVALHDLLKTLMGVRVALTGALALAVLPLAVITARSDTMDSVMAALLIAAFAVAARGLASGRARYAVGAGALLGLAFEAKLFEALVAALPLAVMWWLGAHGTRLQRARAGGAAVAACVVVGLAWLVLVTALVPAAGRPWAFGSSDGSAWNAAFVYDGIGRVTGAANATARSATAVARGRAHLPAAPGPLRLLSGQDGLGPRIGLQLVAAWTAVALVAAAGAWRPLDRAGRAGLVALTAWLLLGTVLFSAQSSLRPRYLEAFDPAVAACIGAGALMLTRARHAAGTRVAVAGVLAAVLTASAVTSAVAAGAHVQDSGTVGALPAPRVQRLSAFLRAHQGRARYELATLAASPAAPLIVRDGRPVLILTAAGRAVVGVDRLAKLVADGQVHAALVGDSCRSTDCTRAAAWVRAHGRDVSRAAGERHAGTLYALGSSR